uniref:helix-turn-helix domain-containing protein n=1 Tax=uncultured Muribaculum sp. TaxID=1918613 RepID=UPI0025ADC74B
KPRKHLDASAIKALKLYPWPGNVRELKDIVLFAAFHAKGDTISEADINFNLSEPEMPSALSLKDPAYEKKMILEALNRMNWNKTNAAKLLGISRSAIDYKIKHYGLKRD